MKLTQYLGKARQSVTRYNGLMECADKDNDYESREEYARRLKIANKKLETIMDKNKIDGEKLARLVANNVGGKWEFLCVKEYAGKAKDKLSGRYLIVLANIEKGTFKYDKDGNVFMTQKQVEDLLVRADATLDYLVAADSNQNRICVNNPLLAYKKNNFLNFVGTSMSYGVASTERFRSFVVPKLERYVASIDIDTNTGERIIAETTSVE